VPGAVVVSTDSKERINNYPQITQITQISVFRSNADSELKASFVELARNVLAVSSGGRSIIVARPPIIVLVLVAVLVLDCGAFQEPRIV
jgi:hypothetical protein